MINWNKGQAPGENSLLHSYPLPFLFLFLSFTDVFYHGVDYKTQAVRDLGGGGGSKDPAIPNLGPTDICKISRCFSF